MGGNDPPMLTPSGEPIMTIDEYLKTLEETTYEEEGDDYPFVSIFDILDAPRILPEPVELTYDHLKQVEGELGLIKLCWPEELNPEFEDRTHFPDSYTKNSEKEKMLLFTAENFRREFRYRFPNRKQMFLACNNECKIQKMVCTSIRPTTLPYAELEDWQSLVSFFGDHMDYEPLEIATLFVSPFMNRKILVLDKKKLKSIDALTHINTSKKLKYFNKHAASTFIIIEQNK